MVYTGGCCLSNGRDGYGLHFIQVSPDRDIGPSLPLTENDTSRRAEVTAAIWALFYAHQIPRKRIRIFTDSLGASMAGCRSGGPCAEGGCERRSLKIVGYGGSEVPRRWC